MGAPSKRARNKIRTASEFDIAKLKELLAPKIQPGVLGWELKDIMGARTQQMLGQFFLPSTMSSAMRADDALFVAKENRLAPQRCIKVYLKPAKGARAKAIASEAEAIYGQGGVGITQDTLRNIMNDLVDHGVAFACNVPVVRPDGSRVDFFVKAWPIQFVRWYESEKVFKTRVDGAVEEVITHGDGRWIVFQDGELYPFRQNAAIIPSALVWARHAFPLSDWAKSSRAHGNAKLIGEMPQGVALQNDQGPTPEAAAFLELLGAIFDSDLPFGIRPAGSKTDFINNSSSAWQVFEQLVLNAEKAAARIYLGTDGTLGSVGGAPGVDIQSLFGVASTKVEGDLRCLERGLLTGSIEPWCAVNFGDSSLAPQRVYLLPDRDADAARASYAVRKTAFHSDVKSARENGFEITQDYLNELAEKHGVEAPTLPISGTKAPSIELAPTDIARVVTVNEARASAGVGILLDVHGQPDPDGLLTVDAYSSKKKAAADAQTAMPAAA
ncbi:MAG: hypothetical protein FWD73_06960 [Polyangiaceae bacterium]|nr:hypothetical protein [Polyangiaceae bacterium]